MAATTTAKKTTAARPSRAAAKKPAFTAEVRGVHVAVADAEGNRVALLHKNDAERWATGTAGKTLRKYVEIVFAGEPVRNWGPKANEAAVFAAAAAAVKAHAEAKAAAKAAKAK